MKKLRGKTGAKITAVILLCVMVLVFVLSAAGIFGADDMGLYSGSYQHAYNNRIHEKASEMLQKVYSNYFFAFNYQSSLYDDNIHTAVYHDGKTDYFGYNGEPIQWAGFCYGDEWPALTVIGAFYTNEQFEAMLESMIKEHSDFVVGYVPEGLVPGGGLYDAVSILYTVYTLRYVMIVTLIVSLVCGIALFGFLMYAAGYKGETVRESFADKIPYDIFSFVLGMAFLGMCGLFVEAINSASFVIAIMLAVATVTVGGLCLLLWLMSTAVRIRTHKLWKNTLIMRLVRLLRRSLSKTGFGASALLQKLPFMWKYLAVIGVILLVEYIFICANWYSQNRLLFGWFIERLLLIGAFVYVLLALNRLRRGIHAIAEGDEKYTVSTQYMKGEFLSSADELNSIRNGLSIAVEERMKSERFKTELITNVSHDIKTPLTSVINYTDLLAKEKPENERMREYIEVISRQAAKLKKLTDDLVEASKASSGVLKTELTATEIAVLMEQTEGEYSDKLSEAGLDFIVEKPEQPLRIMADSRHIWRVFDNLMNNIVKYAQRGTRVYLSAYEENGSAVIVFRNISGERLNITPDKLMERFVRGDASRHNDGSGLGLSIAKSLTELQNGEMNISVDGDLFKVTLRFKKI